jgi:hypothetical protein
MPVADLLFNRLTQPHGSACAAIIQMEANRQEKDCDQRKRKPPFYQNLIGWHDNIDRVSDKIDLRIPA